MMNSLERWLVIITITAVMMLLQFFNQSNGIVQVLEIKSEISSGIGIIINPK